MFWCVLIVVGWLPFVCDWCVLFAACSFVVYCVLCVVRCVMFVVRLMLLVVRCVLRVARSSSCVVRWLRSCVVACWLLAMLLIIDRYQLLGCWLLIVVCLLLIV